MKLEEIRLEPNRYFEEFRDIYDKYAHSYNSFSKDAEKIRFTADIAVIKKEYADQFSQITSEITEQLHLLKKQIFRYCGISVEEKMSGEQTVLVPDGESFTQFSGSKWLDYGLSWLPSLVQTVKRGVKFEDQLKALKQSYRKLLESIEHPTEFEQKHLPLLQRTLQKCKRYYKLSTHIEVIETLTEQIGERNYPQTVDTYNELLPEELNGYLDKRAHEIIHELAVTLSKKGSGKYLPETREIYLIEYYRDKKITRKQRRTRCLEIANQILAKKSDLNDLHGVEKYNKVLEDFTDRCDDPLLLEWEKKFDEKWEDIETTALELAQQKRVDNRIQINLSFSPSIFK